MMLQPDDMVLQSSQRIIWALFRSGAGWAVVQYPTPLYPSSEATRIQPLSTVELYLSDRWPYPTKEFVYRSSFSRFGFLVLVFEESSSLMTRNSKALNKLNSTKPTGPVLLLSSQRFTQPLVR